MEYSEFKSKLAEWEKEGRIRVYDSDYGIYISLKIERWKRSYYSGQIYAVFKPHFYIRKKGDEGGYRVRYTERQRSAALVYDKKSKTLSFTADMEPTPLKKRWKLKDVEVLD